MNKESKVAARILVPLLVAACWLGGAWLFMTLWNVVVPSVFKGPTLTFWQAFAMAFLIVIVGSAFRSDK